MKKYYMKAQAEFLKKLPTRKRVFWGEDQDAFYITPDDVNAALIRIPKPYFYLDPEKLKQKSLPVSESTIKGLIKTEIDFTSAEKIGTKFSENHEYAMLKNSTYTTYVDVKQLKHFSSSAFFEISGELTAIRVYDFAAYHLKTFVGLVLPSWVKE